MSELIPISAEIQAMLQRTGLWRHAVAYAESAQQELAVSDDAPVAKSLPDCSQCDDTGFYIPEIADTTDPRFGRAQRCTCRQNDRAADYLRKSGLNGSERDRRLDWPATVKSHPGAVRDVKSIVEAGHGMAILFGHYGTGKTGLLQAAVATACKSGIAARYVMAPDLLNEIRATFSSDQDTDRLIQRYKSCRFLCIDEIDKLNLTEWARETILTIVDSRYRERGAIATIFATNLIPSKASGGVWRWLAQKDDALAYLDDRLMDALRIDMRGPSQRGK